MKKHYVSFLEFRFEEPVEVSIRGLIETDVQFRISSPEAINRVDGALAFLLHQIGERPASQLFIAANAVPHPDQFAHEPTQEMGVAVVPVRKQSMREHRDIARLTPPLTTSAGTIA